MFSRRKTDCYCTETVQKMNNSDRENFLFEIRPARSDEWETAMELAFRIFLKYEAKEYGPQGIRNFAEFVTDETLKKLFLQGKYILFVAMKEDKMIGMISLRSGNHISLLFVDNEYHRKGVGKALIKYLQEYMLSSTGYIKMTVNAAPYGVPFYHAVGFTDTGVETKTEGIIYTPMEFYL